MTRNYIHSFISDLDFIDNAANAAEEARALLHQAASAFNFLHQALRGGTVDANDDGVIAMLALCGRAFENAAKKEGGMLATIETVLIHAKREEVP